MQPSKATALKGCFLLKVTIFLTILFTVSNTQAQFREIFKGDTATSSSFNDIKGISFINPSTGFVVIGNDIGFTQDSGRTFTKRYITTANINYNGFSGVNGAGFPVGITAFSKDSLLVYCDFFFEPTILFSANQGLNWKMVYHKPINPNASVFSSGITDIKFPGNGSIGFAVHNEEILKTTNRGQTWQVVFSAPNNFLRKLSFPTPSVGYACGYNKIYKTINGGTTWAAISLPTPGHKYCDNIFFTNSTNGYLSGQDGKVFRTVDGGNIWVQTNDSSFNPVAGDDMYFTNDSTGYITLGTNIRAGAYKTTDYGKYWEACVNTPNIATTYPNLFIYFKSIYFYNNQIGWAGGTNQYLMITTDGASKTRPEAYFKIDTIGFSISKTVNLVNFSKKGYQYSWFKNGILLSNDHSTSYTSNRLTIDTVMLTISNGMYTDTLIKMIDTRAPFICAPKPAFSFIIDTSSVKFTNLISSGSYYKHTWSYKDNKAPFSIVVFDTIENPSFKFSNYGRYVVTHTVEPIDAINKWCLRDSTQLAIDIIRTQKCLQPILTTVVDSFYNNQVLFSVTLAQTENIYANNLYDGLLFNFGDGKPDKLVAPNNSIYQVFDANGTYNTKLSVKNNFTGCVSSIIKPITVLMPDTANAEFVTKAPNVINVGPVRGQVFFYGKPNNKTTGKRNTWVLYNKDTINTGNDFNLYKTFTKKASNYGYLMDFLERTNPPYCSSDDHPYTYDYFVDSLVVPVTHIVYDSITKRTDVKSMVIKLNTADDLDSIQIIADTIFPNLIYLNPMSSSKPRLYSSFIKDAKFWVPFNYHVNYSGLNWNGMYLPYMVFTVARDNNILACISDCNGGPSDGREIYKKYYKSKAPLPCSIYPVDFNYKVDSIASKITLTILPQQIVVNEKLGYYSRLYFGDGDSLVYVGDVNTHTYTKPGSYNITLKWFPTSGSGVVASGCASQQITKTIPIVNLCNYNATLSVARNNILPATITFNTTITPDTGNISYKWRFGNGDTSILKTVTYKYKSAGTYLVRLEVKRNNICTLTFDTTIVISAADLCDPTTKYTITRDANNNLVSSATTGNQWYNDTTTIINGATWQSYRPLQSGYYAVKATQNSCTSAFSNRYYYLVTAVVNIDPNSFIKVTPNPAKEFIEINYTVAGVTNVTAELFNITGVKVLTKTNVRNGSKLSISSLANGSYILKITSANGKVNTTTQITKL